MNISIKLKITIISLFYCEQFLFQFLNELWSLTLYKNAKTKTKKKKKVFSFFPFRMIGMDENGAIQPHLILNDFLNDFK